MDRTLYAVHPIPLSEVRLLRAHLPMVGAAGRLDVTLVDGLTLAPLHLPAPAIHAFVNVIKQVRLTMTPSSLRPMTGDLHGAPRPGTSMRAQPGTPSPHLRSLPPRSHPRTAWQTFVPWYTAFTRRPPCLSPQHVPLVASSTARHTWLINDVADPLQRSLTALDIGDVLLGGPPRAHGAGGGGAALQPASSPASGTTPRAAAHGAGKPCMGAGRRAASYTATSLTSAVTWAPPAPPPATVPKPVGSTSPDGFTWLCPRRLSDSTACM